MVVLAACVLTLSAAAAGVSASSVTASSAAAAPVSEADATARANALLARMTLDEKAAQVSQFFMFGDPASFEPKVRAGAGSLLFVTDVNVINRLQRVAVEESRLGIPLLFGFDVIHGLRTIFPVPIGMAASWDPSAAERAQAIAAN
ncbi:MAG: glycoside hydrolase family 3 N-terminal domain-containing protein, partial [Brevundimonas sp.]|uniref:glycoside hydrolase family 3 N-terminal domain-containing protein n=1 Tax=Brevundimonas sp. TaxID=1871086 RepID=UPI00271AC5AE